MAFACPPSPWLKASSCQRPWPGSLAHCCFGKHIFKTPWFWDQPRSVLARGGSSQKAAWNRAPLCHMQRSCNGDPEWSDHGIFHHFPACTKSFALKGCLKLWRSSVQGGCLGARWAVVGPLLLWGDYREGGTKFLGKGHFFSYLSIKYLSKLLSASLSWSKTILLFVYLNTLYQFKLTESLQRSHWPSPIAEFPATHYSQWIWFIHL